MIVHWFCCFDTLFHLKLQVAIFLMKQKLIFTKLYFYKLFLFDAKCHGSQQGWTWIKSFLQPSIQKYPKGPQNSFKSPLFRHFVWEIVQTIDTMASPPLAVRNKLQICNKHYKMNFIWLLFPAQ
jgi:hypothetical protein